MIQYKITEYPMLNKNIELFNTDTYTHNFKISPFEISMILTYLNRT